MPSVTCAICGASRDSGRDQSGHMGGPQARALVAAVVTENGTFGQSSAPKAFCDEGTHNFKPILLVAFNLLTRCYCCKQLAKREGVSSDGGHRRCGELL